MKNDKFFTIENKKKVLNDIVRANSYTFRANWVAIGFAAFAWLLNCFNIFIVNQNLMNIAFIGALMLGLISVMFRFVLGFENKGTGYILLFIMVAVVTYENMMLSYHTTLFLVFPMICSLFYCSRAFEIYTFVLSVIGELVATVGSYLFGLCDANMLLLTKDITNFYIKNINAGNIELNSNLAKIVLFFAFPKIITLTGFLVLISAVRRVMTERTKRETESRRKAETDGLTGLYNRAKFIETKEALSHYEGNIAVIYIDINDLKLVNDTKGHEYGDKLITGISGIIDSIQDDNISGYRIGGDEFVVFVVEPKEDDVLLLIDNIKKESYKRRIDDNTVLSVAIGFAEGKASELQNLLEDADEKMYLDKQKTKKDNPNNRGN